MTTPTKQLHLTITAAIHARFAHRVDGLVHSHPWSIEATVEGPADASKVMPADEANRLFAEAHGELSREELMTITPDDILQSSVFAEDREPEDEAPALGAH